ncbi:MAG: fatty acyl-AMP ligase [Polyangiaceae bacterium]
MKELSIHRDRGFWFVRSDGSERFVSYAEMWERAHQRAAFLRGKGLEKGDRVALVVPDGDEFVLSFLGAIVGGLVPVPMYPQLSFKNVATYHDTVSHIVDASGAKLLVTTKSTVDFVAPVQSRTPSLKDIVLTDSFAELKDERVDVAVAPEDMCFLQFTSGSTSKPKGVMVSHLNLAWNSECFMIHGLGKDSYSDKGVSWLPLFHDMGLIGFVIGPLFTNIQVAFLPTANFVRSPRIWLDTLSRHRGTITYAPNFAYSLVSKRVKEKDLAGLDLSCVRHAGCGAEPIQSRTLREFAEKLAPAGFNPKAFLPSYGMAEATLAISFSEQRGNPDENRVGMRTDDVDPKALELGTAKKAEGGAESSELVNCGRAFPEHEIAIVDENGKRLEDRQVGQIITRGPSICAGYYQNPEATAEGMRDGWLYTGDLGYMVKGEVFVCGRLKDMIIVRGRNFYPNDLEWSVGELERVRRGNVVAFGINVDGAEELVICAEAFSSGSEGLVDEIAQLIVDRFSLTAHKVELVPQGSIPRTSSGKPQRRKAKQMFLDGEFAKLRTKGTDVASA